MTKPLRSAAPAPPAGLAEGGANELLLIAGAAIDSAAHLLVQGRSVWAWLAAGRLSASMMLSNRAWDVSAGVLLAREAGG